jgi:pimeloyl-ACP methyl ester carboxylesterase
MDGYVHTDDEVSLRYTVHGAGRPVVFAHGWQGAADPSRPAAEALGGERRAVRCDRRGHGRSHDARSSWTAHRLAYALGQLLEQLALTDAVLVGHSMGCSVIWAYLELFGAARLERLLLVDHSPAMVADPVWDERTVAWTGAIFTDRQMHALMSQPRRPRVARGDGARDRRRDGDPSRLAGRTSVVPWTDAEWIAHKIPGARLEIFELDEGGSDLLALENPTVQPAATGVRLRRPDPSRLTAFTSRPHTIHRI